MKLNPNSIAILPLAYSIYFNLGDYFMIWSSMKMVTAIAISTSIPIYEHTLQEAVFKYTENRQKNSYIVKISAIQPGQEPSISSKYATGEDSALRYECDVYRLLKSGSSNLRDNGKYSENLYRFEFF